MALNAFGYMHDLVLSIRRNVGPLLPGAPEALDSLVAAIVRDATPPVRRQSGFHVIDRSARDRDGRVDFVEDGTPDLVRVVAPLGQFAFCFPNFLSGKWVRLSGRIEPNLLDQVLRADGVPVRGTDIEALKECQRQWMKVVWMVNFMAPAPRDGGEATLIECTGDPSRPRGQKRQLDPKDERPDTRAFFIRPHRWHIERNVSAQTLDNVEALVLERFGKPSLPGARSPEESPEALRSCRTP